MENQLECLKIIRVRCDCWIYLFIGLIVHCKAEGVCTRIYVRYGVNYLVTGLLSEIEALIDSKSFKRLGRSYLVNPDYFSELFKDCDGCTFCFGDLRNICPAPKKATKDFIELIAHSKDEHCYCGKLESNKKRQKYLAAKVRKSKKNAKSRRRWKWEWEKEGSNGQH